MGLFGKEGNREGRIDRLGQVTRPGPEGDDKKGRSKRRRKA